MYKSSGILGQGQEAKEAAAAGFVRRILNWRPSGGGTGGGGSPDQKHIRNQSQSQSQSRSRSWDRDRDQNRNQIRIMRKKMVEKSYNWNWCCEGNGGRRGRGRQGRRWWFSLEKLSKMKVKDVGRLIKVTLWSILLPSLVILGLFTILHFLEVNMGMILNFTGLNSPLNHYNVQDPFGYDQYDRFPNHPDDFQAYDFDAYEESVALRAWVLGWFLCKTVPYVQGVTVCASIYSLVAISVDRYLAIWFPLRCQITKRKTRIVILGIWVWSALLALPWLLYFDLAPADSDQPSLLFCVEVWPESFNGNVYFVCVNLILFYLAPLAIISFCYICIWLRVWRRHIPNDSHYLSRIELIHQRAKVGVLKMLMFVVFAFILSWLPLYVIFARLKLVETPLGRLEEEIISLATPVAQWLGASNSCINPILYAFLNVKFRRAFFSLIRPYKWSRNPTPHYDKPNVLTLRKFHNQLRLQKVIRVHTSVYNMTEL